MTGAYALPPGPQRRTLLLEMGWNIGREDYTDAEWAALDQHAAELLGHKDGE